MIFRIRYLDPGIEEAVETVASKWIGTRYMPGQRARGMYVDCAQLIPGVLDTLYRRPSPTPLPRLRGDVSTHDDRVALQTIRILKKAYGAKRAVDGFLEAGDVLITKADHGRRRTAGHAMIVLPRGRALHAMPHVGVVITTIQSTRAIVRVYRPEGKVLWAL